MTHQDPSPQHLPACVIEYISHVIRRMRYSRSARREVKQELLDHFTDALADCPDPQERQRLAETLIADFGDAKLLATLLRRAKKRNRPAWLKALIRTGQAILLLLVLCILYTAWFFTGQPTISTDYVAVLSERIQPKAPESENAWPFYKQAIRAFVEPPQVTPPRSTQPTEEQPPATNVWPDMDVDPARMPGFLQAALRQWVDQNQPAWRQYTTASLKPYCWYSYDTLKELIPQRPGVQATATQPYDWIWERSMFAVQIPHLSPLRQLSRIGIWQARLDSAQGHSLKALNEARTVARAGRHWQNNNAVVIEQLVGMAINNLGCEEIRRLAADKTLTATDLRKAQEDLESLYTDGYPTLGIEAEQLTFVDTVQRLFTQGGLGGGHPIPLQAQVLWNSLTPSPPGTVRDGPTNIGLWTAASLVHAGRDETLSVGNAFYDRLAERSRLSPYQRKGQPDPDQMIENLSRPRHWMLHMFLPSLSRAGDNAYRARAEYEATLAVLALQRYRLDKDQYPPNLETLVETGYLQHIPADPYSAGPLVYRRTGDLFTLYSVGGNFQDDGGVHNPDDPWGASKGSDRVFWPVPALKPFAD